jgi:RecA-family ATPase
MPWEGAMLDKSPMTAAALAKELGGTRHGNRWRCRCPAHADADPSLDITDGDNGRVLVNCRAGCEQADVIDALHDLGLHVGGSGGNGAAAAALRQANGAATGGSAQDGATLLDIVPAGAPPLDLEAVLRGCGAIKWRGGKRVVIERDKDGAETVHDVHGIRRFDVKDRAGRLLYVEARIEYGWQERKGRPDKTHRPVTLWRLPDGRFEWRAKGYRKPGPLYGLETLDANPGAPVVIHEGPHKADKGRELAPGCVHLALMGGTATVEHSDWSVLKDRDAVLGLDADGPGEKATAAARPLIAKAGARRIGAITPPTGAPAGWGIDDLTDQEAAAGTAETLIAEALDGAKAETAEPSLATADILEELTDPTKLAGIEPPAREWIVPGWLPVGSVTSLYGRGGVGKTLLAQQIQTAVGTGRPFFGLETTQCKVLSFFCEDDEAELHRRQVCINASLGVGMEDLGGIRWQGRFGKANVMVTVEGGILKPTEFRAFVREAAVRFGARLLILDNVAQLFAGNENIRAEVTQFVNDLGAIAQEINGAVLLLGHPGKADGSEFSGSTAWDATVRSRWILERPKEDLDDQDAGELADLRVLRKAKANYSGTGDEITLRWDQGVFRVEGAPKFKDAVDRIEERVQETADDAAFLAGLRRLLQTGFEPSHKVEARTNYAPKLLRQTSECKGVSVDVLKRSMKRLMTSDEIVLGWSAGPPSRRKRILMPKDMASEQDSDRSSDTSKQGSDRSSDRSSDTGSDPTDSYGQGPQVIDIPSSQTAYEHPTDTYGQGPQVIDIPSSDRCSDTPHRYYVSIEEDAAHGSAASSSDDDTVEAPAQDSAHGGAEPAEPDPSPDNSREPSGAETAPAPDIRVVFRRKP